MSKKKQKHFTLSEAHKLFTKGDAMSVGSSRRRQVQKFAGTFKSAREKREERERIAKEKEATETKNNLTAEEKSGA